MNNKKVLFLLGVQDNNQTVVNYHDGSFNCQLEGNTNLFAPLEPKDVDKDFFVIGGAVNIQRKVAFADFIDNSDLLFNCVSDADSNSRVLGFLGEKLTGYDVPVINHPASVLGTSREAGGLLGRDIAGLWFPRTFRIKSPRDPEMVLKALDVAGLTLPFIIRKTGTHGGQSVLRIDGFADLRQLNTIGYDGGDMYLSEYVDYADADGLYRKLRLVVVDGQIFPRHQIVSNHWMIHAGSRNVLMEDREDLRREEQYVLENFADIVGEQCLAGVRELFGRTGLDFMGIDCSIRPDGRLLVFEANASMNIFVQSNPQIFPYLDGAREPIKQAMEALIYRRLGR